MGASRSAHCPRTHSQEDEGLHQIHHHHDASAVDDLDPHPSGARIFKRNLFHAVTDENFKQIPNTFPDERNYLTTSLLYKAPVTNDRLGRVLYIYGTSGFGKTMNVEHAITGTGKTFFKKNCDIRWWYQSIVNQSLSIDIKIVLL